MVWPIIFSTSFTHCFRRRYLYSQMSSVSTLTTQQKLLHMLSFRWSEHNITDTCKETKACVCIPSILKHASVQMSTANMNIISLWWFLISTPSHKQSSLSHPLSRHMYHTRSTKSLGTFSLNEVWSIFHILPVNRLARTVLTKPGMWQGADWLCAWLLL